MNKVIIRNLDEVEDIKKAMLRAVACVINFNKQRELKGAIRVCFYEKGKSAEVFSEPHGKDSIIYTWKNR